MDRRRRTKYSFFLGARKNKTNKKGYKWIIWQNGKSTTDQNEIMEIEVDYYKKLYKSTNPDNDKLITGKYN